MRLSPFARLDAHFAPAPERKRVAFLTAQPFAHRGLHGEGRIENSRAAFAAAIAAGHGIELDVQAGRSETLPRLHEILALVAARAPILIELKSPDANASTLCLAVRRALEGYR